MSRVRHRPVLLASSLLSTAIAPPACAFRCGNYLVNVGDWMGAVEAHCGAPTARYPRSLVGRRGTPSYAGETWVYNFGPHSFVALATFENGRVIAEGYGDYGW